jgi:hypothetical protein
MAHDDVATQIHAERAAARAFDRVDHFVGELQRVKVGATDSTGQRLDEDFTGPERGNRHLIDDEFFVSHYGGAHKNLRAASCYMPRRRITREYHITAPNPQEQQNRARARLDDAPRVH